MPCEASVGTTGLTDNPVGLYCPRPLPIRPSPSAPGAVWSSPSLPPGPVEALQTFRRCVPAEVLHGARRELMMKDDCQNLTGGFARPHGFPRIVA